MKSVIQNLQHRAKLYSMPLVGIVVVFVTVLTVVGLSPKGVVRATTGDWTTYLGSNAHTGFNATETTISPASASGLQLIWQAQTPGKISSEPLLVNGVLYWGDWAGLMHATNSSTGKDNWATNLGTKVGSCGTQTFGIVGTATVATITVNGVPTQAVFVGGGQDNLYALDANTGSIIWKTNLGNSPAELIYGSPAVYNGSVYIGVSSSGDCPLVPGVMYQLNASSGAMEHSFTFVPNGCIGVGIWDTPTIDETTGMLYVGTGNSDPNNCLNSEPLGSSLVELKAADLSLVSSWQVPSSLGYQNNDFGSTPTLFQATINGVSHAMVGLVSKDGEYYAFDRTNISAGPLWKTTISVAGPSPEFGHGSISSSAYDGTRLYVAGGNTTITKAPCQGSLRALDPNTGAFLWELCRSNPALGAVIAVPGLVVVGAGNAMVVVNAATGSILYNFLDKGSNARFWGSAIISHGILYYGSRSGTLFAFGVSNVPTPGPSPSPSVSSTSSPTPKPVNGPTSKTWYFAEGKVGAGFTEYLTMENPDPINDCSVTIQYLRSAGSSINKTVIVPHASRFTESVNSDLNTPTTSGTYQANSAIVSVTNAPCAGIVAERPMYFTNFAGISSGSDVLGSTHTGTTFYFADVPTGGNYASFLTIMNPGTTTAMVSATFVAGGGTVSSQTQSIAVAGGTRGTIIPNNGGALLHAAVTVTSNQPVVVERPTYFHSVNGGNAQTVTGASSIVGAQTLGKEWLFAEGYTGPGFQEDFVLANFGSTPITANVVLEFSNGHTETVPETIQPSNQTMVDVNAILAGNHGTCDTSPCQPTQALSADIIGNGNFIAQREMFFHYTHISNGRSLSATGGSDVIGERAPAVSAYSFAEGYTNAGYDEWLTLQNPTANAETIGLTLVNGEGRTYKQQLSITAHSRFTVDITGMVLQTLITPNDIFKGYEVSMVVQSSSGSFVAERPMYWNTGPSGTQGGSDIFGYIGN